MTIKSMTRVSASRTMMRVVVIAGCASVGVTVCERDKRVMVAPVPVQSERVMRLLEIGFSGYRVIG